MAVSESFSTSSSIVFDGSGIRPLDPKVGPGSVRRNGRQPSENVRGCAPCSGTQWPDSMPSAPSLTS